MRLLPGISQGDNKKKTRNYVVTLVVMDREMSIQEGTSSFSEELPISSKEILQLTVTLSFHACTMYVMVNFVSNAFSV